MGTIDMKSLFEKAVIDAWVELYWEPESVYEKFLLAYAKEIIISALIKK